MPSFSGPAFLAKHRSSCYLTSTSASNGCQPTLRSALPELQRRQLLAVLLLLAIGCFPDAPVAWPHLAADSPPPSSYSSSASEPLEVSSAQQLVAAISDSGVASVRLTDNVLVDPAAWPRATLVRSSNFTIFGADWFPILDLAFVEGKVHLQPGVTFIFGKVELRNVRTRSGFEVDMFDCSPNATVRYASTVYFCFSCLPLSYIVNAVEAYVITALPNIAVASNVSWVRVQAPLQETYRNDRVVWFQSASAVLAAWGMPGAASGGGYEMLATDVSFVCQSPIDPATCDTKRGIDHCVSSTIEALAGKDDTWSRLVAWKGAGSGGSGGGNGTTNSVAVAAVVGGADGGGGEGGRISMVVGAAVGGAAGGVALVAAVTVSMALCRRRLNSRRHGQQRGCLGSVIDSDASAPMAVKIVVSELGEGEGKEGGGGKGGASGGGGDPAHDRTFPGNGSKDNGAQTLVAVALAAQPPRAQQQQQRQQLASPYGSCGGGGRSGNSAPLAAASAAAPQVLTAVIPGASVTLTTLSTLGESFHPLSGSSGSGIGEGKPSVGRGVHAGAAWHMAAAAVAAGAGHDGGGGGAMAAAGTRGQPVVVVADITIELLKVIGAGSFGKVFRGFWQSRPVAVKVLQYGGELCRAVHNEVLLSHTLRHPNVVAALYFAQVLPGGGLGLHTSSGQIVADSGDGDGGGRASAANPQMAAAGLGGAGAAAAAAAVAKCGQQKVMAGSFSRCIVSGIAPDSASEAGGAFATLRVTSSQTNAGARPGGSGAGGGGGQACAVQRELPVPLSAPEGCIAVGGAAVGFTAAARMAPISVRVPRHRSTTTSLPLPLSGSDGVGCLDGHGGGDGDGGPQTASAPLMWLRQSDIRVTDVAEMAGPTSYESSGSDGDDNADGGRSFSEPDVLSRWDEQRRRQELVDRVGTKLIGPELVVSSKGFLLHASTAAGGGAAAAAPTVGCGSGSGDLKAPPNVPILAAAEAEPCSTLSGGAAAAAAASARVCGAALPLEALWLAAHTQRTEGVSHGFLVMELCEGGSAFAWRRARWCGPEHRPNLSVVLRVALDIAYGMSYIHSMGICHGDLKLSNVLLARSSDTPALARANSPNDLLAGWVAKVCDFGLSRVLTGGRTHVSTRPHGTPTHMAPELWTKGHMSQPADVYAYGITLWELATGERPYKGLNAARILHRVLLDGGRPALPLWLPPSYTRLVASCWAQSAKDRPTFGEIVRHLEAGRAQVMTFWRRRWTAVAPWHHWRRDCALLFYEMTWARRVAAWRGKNRKC